MLNTLRQSVSGIVAKIFIALLVLSFAVWGVADIFRGYRGDEVARVGETEIPVEVFRNELQREIQQVSQRIGTYLTMDQARSVGLDRRVLGRLVAQATLDEDARRRGLGMSDTVVARSIREDDAFQTPGGQFDRSYFQQYLQATGYSEAQFVDEHRGRVLRQTIAESVGMTGEAPTVLAAAVDRYQREQRTADYLVVTPEWLDAIPEPSEEELSAYFEENRAQFRTPEYRRVGILAADPEEIAANMEVSEEDLRAAYEARADEFSTPERRTIEQIPFGTPEAAQEAYEAIEGGDSFEAVAERRGVADSDRMLGTLSRDEVVDPAMAEAAFALPEGEVSEPVEGTFSTVLLRVTEVEEGGGESFEEIADRLRRDLALNRAEGDMLDLYDDVEDDRAAGLTLEEIAESRGLKYREVAVDAEGRGRDGAPADLPDADDLVAEAFRTDPGIEADPVQLGATGYVWFDVQEVTPAGERTFEEARADVADAWVAERTAELLRERAEAAAEALRGGASFSEVAEAAEAQAATAGPLTRAGDHDVFGRTALDTLFATPEGETATAPAADGPGRIVFRVADVAVPQYAPDAGDPMRQQIAGGIADDLLEQYIQGLQDTYGVQINQQAVSVALGEQPEQ